MKTSIIKKLIALFLVVVIVLSFYALYSISYASNNQTITIRDIHSGITITVPEVEIFMEEIMFETVDNPPLITLSPELPSFSREFCNGGITITIPSSEIFIPENFAERNPFDEYGNPRDFMQEHLDFQRARIEYFEANAITD